LFLYVRAGGLCEFDGCRRYVLEHYPTFTPGNFAQMAHIWAFSSDGPRGHEGVDPTDLNHIENLILLCPQCHTLIDQNPERFTVDMLRKFKRAHEDRIYCLTSTDPARQTVALRMTANIGDHAVEIGYPAMYEAVAPRYFNPREVVDIDLTSMEDHATPNYWAVAQAKIVRKIKRLYETAQEDKPVAHVSVFALAPIPLLVFLGSQLSNKIPTSFFQRHRDTQSWVWQEGPATAAFSWQQHQAGTDPKSVAVMYSLSGRIHTTQLPPIIDASFSVYELALASEPPHPRFLKTEDDLSAFRSAQSNAVRAIVAGHPGLERIHIFPAVPAPVAIAMSWELLPKHDPALLIFDYDKQRDGFQPTLEVNTR
jgi:hypothetical protein